MTNSDPSAIERRLPRRRYLSIIATAVQAGEYRFARDAALTWLSTYPGDLEINLQYAQALLAEDQPRLALPVLESICQVDPEYLEAAETRLRAEYLCEGRHWPESIASVLALSDQLVDQETVVTWGRQLWLSRQCLQNHQFEEAEDWIRSCLASNPNSPLVAVTHLRILEAQGDDALAARCQLADFYHRRWPRCAACTLLLADWLMDGGNSDQAVALLHQAAANDIGGQIARRLWGGNHPYQAIWPEHLESLLDQRIPASVTALLGWNQLSSGEQAAGQNAAHISSTPTSLHGPDLEVSTPEVNESSVEEQEIENNQPENTSPTYEAGPPESLRSVKEELERMAKKLNRPDAVQGDGRFPVYVIFSTRCGLERLYGVQGADILVQEMKTLAEVVQRRGDWGARVFLADQAEYTTPLDLEPAHSDGAWGLKLALVDLDSALSKRGERIGAVLIVGGPEVVPFHHLPNPIDDDDADVPSDNPYATRDENYFVPEWPLGRLPGGRSADPSLLLKLLRSAQAFHTQEARKISWQQEVWARLVDWLRLRLNGERNSLGYSAAVWQRASRTVFDTLAGPGKFYLSPPLDANCAAKSTKTGIPLPATRLGYFNLHGLADSAEWYGQRDPLQDPEGVEYPVAIRPQDVSSGSAGRPAPQVVFSEACYGAHILGKSTDEAMALKFLDSGSQTVVSSTGMAYGSIGAPLIAADLLGQAFWSYLHRGLPAGEALLRAKIHLAQEMHQRQGYLDGEDQKTLISFVFYGDPLTRLRAPHSFKSNASKNGRNTFDGKLLNGSTVKTVCDRAGDEEQDKNVPPEMMNYVKHIVAQYLPGMEGSQVVYSQEHGKCTARGHHCPTRDLNGKSTFHQQPGRQIVTLNKQVVSAKHVHTHYARLTLDTKGKLVKLVVSR